MNEEFEDEELDRLIEEMMAERDNEEEGEDEDADDETAEEEPEADEDGDEEPSEEEATDDDGDEDGANDESDESGEDEGDTDESAGEGSEHSFAPVTLNVNGVDVEVGSMEDLLAYARAGAKTYGQNKQPTDTSLIVEQGKLDVDTLRLVVDAKSGDKAAIAKLVKTFGADALEVEEHEQAADSYQTQFREHRATDVERMISEVQQDQALAAEFNRLGTFVPEDFQMALGQSPERLGDFINHVKTGLAAEIIPRAINHQMTKGGSFMDAYTKVGTDILTARATAQDQPQQRERQVDKRAQKLRDKATSTNPRTTSNKTAASEDDVWDMSDEEFEEALKNGTLL